MGAAPTGPAGEGELPVAEDSVSGRAALDRAAEAGDRGDRHGRRGPRINLSFDFRKSKVGRLCPEPEEFY